MIIRQEALRDVGKCLYVVIAREVPMLTAVASAIVLQSDKDLLLGSDFSLQGSHNLAILPGTQTSDGICVLWQIWIPSRTGVHCIADDRFEVKPYPGEPRSLDAVLGERVSEVRPIRAGIIRIIRSVCPPGWELVS